MKESTRFIIVGSGLRRSMLIEGADLAERLYVADREALRHNDAIILSEKEAMDLFTQEPTIYISLPDEPKKEIK